MSLQIEKQTAKRLFETAPDWFQKQLINEFGEATFKTKEFEKIKTFEDACNMLGIDPASVINENDQPDEKAYKQLKVIIKAINSGWEPNWNDTNQYKWFPVFNLSSGFGFSGSSYFCTYSVTPVGSRLCTDTSEKALYIAKQFQAEYEDYFLYKE